MSDDDMIRRGDALECFMGYDRTGDIKDAIAALPAVTVRVKPLVWKQEATNAWVAAHYAIHQYGPHNNGLYSGSGYLRGIGAMALGRHPTLDAAKAAAQADYEARVRAALEPVAAPAPAAIREAAQMERMQNLIDAYEDIMDYGIVFAKKDQQDRLKAAKEKLANG